MELQDTSPERRNLNLFAILAITYSIGGASFVDGQVKLALINAQFTNVGYLAILFILGFFWVTLRCYITHKWQFQNARNKGLYLWKPPTESSIESKLRSKSPGNTKIVQVVNHQYFCLTDRKASNKSHFPLEYLHDHPDCKSIKLNKTEKLRVNIAAFFNSNEMSAMLGTFIFCVIGWVCVFFEVYQYCNQ
ncbi:hypothetical protein GCM10008107_29900 [Psychrosphaera saromensis]|uniref:Uncharacterized protein n=1 Tax=Psychrosphaera saromensis TaxID=716813 RepID=A0A2S7UZ52_9GAMM|nr:hypothetical protein [Psychrosphaera saromensis]PQJ55059.1 hypothetical protein BTO11_16295 [Psychrosphaera saromensis]GHB78422.1 hypothetical protein GCM10008107_29900 [Psychrosphaera saromensis]GLQ13643.1 hypothetical protein GCM10007917_10980 [Psychrosphaera saromensis]